MNSPPRPAISVTDLGEYVRHQSCDRRFYLKVRYDREVWVAVDRKITEDACVADSRLDS